MSNGPTFTILLPVTRPPHYLPFALESVLRQTRTDFELLIVGDGAPPETIAAARHAAASDSRIRVLPFPKGARHGESHRHTALESARGRFVCHIADDDQWFPEHLAETAVLLDEFDFGHLLHINITAGDQPFVLLADLADPANQSRMASEVFNFFGPSNAGYRLDAYRRLPTGWSPAPPALPTDLFMWRKFLALPGLRAATRFVITSLHFAASQRSDWSVERRRAESARYAGEIATSQGRDQLRQRAMRNLAREHQARHAYILQLLEAARTAR